MSQIVLSTEVWHIIFYMHQTSGACADMCPCDRTRIHRGRTYIQKHKSHFSKWTFQIIQIRMGDNTNLFTLSESAINAIKKPELVQKIIALKGEVIMDADISNFCNQISKLNNTVSQLHSTNEKIRSDLAVVKNVNTKLEEQIISLEKNQAKSE